MTTVKLKEENFNKFLAALWICRFDLPECKFRKKLTNKFYESDFGKVPLSFNVQFRKEKKNK